MTYKSISIHVDVDEILDSLSVSELECYISEVNIKTTKHKKLLEDMDYFQQVVEKIRDEINCKYYKEAVNLLDHLDEEIRKCQRS